MKEIGEKAEWNNKRLVVLGNGRCIGVFLLLVFVIRVVPPHCTENPISITFSCCKNQSHRIGRFYSFTCFSLDAFIFSISFPVVNLGFLMESWEL